MAQVAIGRTGITVEKNGFGALPIQRISKEDAVYCKYAPQGKSPLGGIRFNLIYQNSSSVTGISSGL